MKNLQSKETILNYLNEGNKSESDLCEVCGTDNHYFFIYPDIDSSILLDELIGVCIIKSTDGYFSIPVESLRDGMEYFDTSSITDVSKEDLNYYKEKLEAAVKRFDFFTNL